MEDQDNSNIILTSVDPSDIHLNDTTYIDYNNDNTFIFTISRMNPPTPGHMRLVKTLINLAISGNINHIYIILSKTDDDIKNPLKCENEKKQMEDIGFQN